jgi:hypothetical protein
MVKSGFHGDLFQCSLFLATDWGRINFEEDQGQVMKEPKEHKRVGKLLQEGHIILALSPVPVDLKTQFGTLIL